MGALGGGEGGAAAQGLGRFLETDVGELILPPGADTKYPLHSPPRSFKCALVKWEININVELDVCLLQPRGVNLLSGG